VRFIGDRERFAEKLKSGIEQAEKLTENNKGLALNIAANYGGRWDITQACKSLAAKVLSGDISVDDINEETFNSAVCLNDLPSPDLYIRTGGESRISNFLVWQLAYTELYFTAVLWPDFDLVDLDKALDWYASRQRRFGMTSAQVDQNREAG
jgi:undecaprenyl diphosphate synthase